MNDTLNTIFKRRSCRKYLKKDIHEDILNDILEAGKAAPSAKNLQAASILCIKNPDIVEDLRRHLVEFLGRDPLYGAQIVVIVYADKTSRFAFQDGTCVLENMFIAATSLGIGSCWINCLHDFFATEDGNHFKKEILHLDDNDITIGTCILGYAVEEGQQKPKKDNYIRII